MNKFKFELAKESLNIAIRVSFAVLALLALVIGGTLRLYIEGDQTMLPGLPIALVRFGEFAIAVLIVILLLAVRRSHKLFHKLEQLVTEEDES